MRFHILALLGALSAPASAEVLSANPNGFHVRHEVQAVVPQERAFQAFERVGGWWDPEHTYSGNAANLRLTVSPGGCFCERLPGGGGIEHMRVAYVQPDERIVMTGSLGPLLFEATSGVMDVKFERIAGGSRVTMDYKVSGFANGGAEKIAPIVDQVLGTQMKRFRAAASAEPATR